jgi:hypothetical protein
MVSNIAMIYGKCGFDRTHNLPRVVIDDVTLRTIVSQYGLMWGVDPSSMRRGGGISHHLSSET